MKTHLNLLPIGYLRARLVRRRLALWTPVWGASVLFGMANWWSSYTAYCAASHTFANTLRHYAPVRKLTNEIDQLRRRIDELNNRETMLGELSEPHPPLSGLALVGGCAAQCEGQVRVNHMLLERSAGVVQSGRRQLPGAQAAAVENSDRSQLTLEGVGLDNVSVATFVEALRDTGAFLKVELKSTIRAGNDSGAMRQFVVSCEY
jgi:hypothetical protein